MEKKISKFVSNVGENAKKLLEKSKEISIRAADQNNDGEFNLEDVTIVAGNVENAVRKGAHVLKETVDERTRQLELKTLQPLFLEELNDPDFVMSKFMRVTERDKKYLESEVCQNSIGFRSDKKDLLPKPDFSGSPDSRTYEHSWPGQSFLDNGRPKMSSRQDRRRCHGQLWPIRWLCRAPERPDRPILPKKYAK